VILIRDWEKKKIKKSVAAVQPQLAAAAAAATPEML